MARLIIPESRPILGWHLAERHYRCYDDAFHQDEVVAETRYTSVTIRVGDVIEARGGKTRRAPRLNHTRSESEAFVSICEYGPHCSINALDTFIHGHGPILSLVEMTGHCHMTRKPGCVLSAGGKIVAQRRRHVAMVDASDVWEERPYDFSTDDARRLMEAVGGIGTPEEYDLVLQFWKDIRWPYYEMRDPRDTAVGKMQRLLDKILDRRYRDLFARIGVTVPTTGWLK